MQRQAIFRGTYGLRTVVDRTETSVHEDISHLDIAACSNVVVSDSGKRVYLRPGTARVYTPTLGEMHSGFGVRPHSWKLFVEGNTLTCYDTRTGQVRRLQVLVDPLAKMAYEYAGTFIYFANGTDLGVISTVNWSVSSWAPVGTYAGPTTMRSITGPPPDITQLKVHGGRMYVNSDSYVCYSEPFDFRRFVLDEDNFPLPEGTKIVLFGNTQGGLVIGTTNGIWFMTGFDPLQADFRQVWDSPVISGTGQAVFPSTDFGTEDMRRSFICTTADGVVLITPDSMATSLSKGHIDMPLLAGYQGSSVIMDGFYICKCNVEA